mgnify:CR=1 FL=1
MTIRLLITGGTFDKEYDELTGRLFFKETHLPEMLRRARCRVDVRAETLMMIDSLDMTDEDRQLIRRKIEADPCSRIVVTHGTDTLIQTAKVLQGMPGKTIVLTGSMQPSPVQLYGCRLQRRRRGVLPPAGGLGHRGRGDPRNRCGG